MTVRPKRAMLLAAGLGLRMRPLTELTPKPLVRLAGKPLLDYVLDRLAAAGVETVVLNVHYLPKQIIEHVATRRAPKIVISDESAELLDTGGGVAKALAQLGNEPFYIVNADSISLPGGGAEILVDRVRRKIAKAKCTSEEWLGVMRVAHQMGLRSSATMMYGTVDTLEDRIQHLVKIRDLQDETGGFTAFFCWDYQFEKGTHLTPGDNGTHLYLRTQAVARLMLDNVEHVGASWVTQGPAVGQVALRFGADDFGSVMFEENVVSSAGTTFGINAEKIEGRIRQAGFKAVRRNVRYDWLNEPG